jgi:hypothetical protein
VRTRAMSGFSKKAGFGLRLSGFRLATIGVALGAAWAVERRDMGPPGRTEKYKG